MAAPAQTQPPSPVRIFGALTAHEQTAALKTAIELEVFTVIGEGELVSERPESGLPWGTNVAMIRTMPPLVGRSMISRARVIECCPGADRDDEVAGRIGPRRAGKRS